MFSHNLGYGLDGDQMNCFTEFEISSTSCLDFGVWNITQTTWINRIEVQVYGYNVKDICCAGWEMVDCIVEAVKSRASNDPICLKACDLAKENVKNSTGGFGQCIGYPYGSDECVQKSNSTNVSLISFWAMITILTLRLLN